MSKIQLISSFWDIPLLSLKLVFHCGLSSTLGWSPKSKFKIDSSNFQLWFGPLNVCLNFKKDLRFLTFNILRLSSIGGRHYFKKHLILVWSPYHKLKSWGNPISGSWDIHFLIFCGCLPLEVAVTSRNLSLWLVHYG